MSERAGILVLGMHRSGTSMLTKALGTLGAALPRRPMLPQPENPRGFFEPLHAAPIHDAILADLGSAWDDWTFAPDPMLLARAGRARAGEIEALIQADFGAADLFVFKDPRVCRLVPVWLEVLAGMDVRPVAVISVRNPLEVAWSLFRRNRLAPQDGLLLWLSHVLAAERHSRGIPRAFASYEAMLAEPVAALARLVAQLPPGLLRDPAAGGPPVAADVEASLRHQRFLRAEVAPPTVPRPVREALDQIERLVADPLCPAAMAALDGIRGDFEFLAQAARRRAGRHASAEAAARGTA